MPFNFIDIGYLLVDIYTISYIADTLLVLRLVVVAIIRYVVFVCIPIIMAPSKSVQLSEGQQESEPSKFRKWETPSK